MVYAVIGLAIAVVLFTSIIKHVNWNTQVKNAVASVLSVAAAAVATVFSNDVDLTPGNLFQLALGIYGLSQLIYNFLLSGNSPLANFEEKLAQTEVV